MNPRREFIKKSMASLLLPQIASQLIFNQKDKENSNSQFSIVVFSKYLQNLKGEELIRACKECELDGIDLTVREKGHIEPQNVVSELPKLSELFNKSGLTITMITTNLIKANTPYANEVIQTASKVGIKYIRCGYHKYNFAIGIKKQWELIKEDLKSLAELAEKYNVNMGYHNHSGEGNFGAPMWDLVETIAEINSPRLGLNLDLGHLKAEGFAGAWKTNLMFSTPWIKMLAIKDFTVENDKVKWVKLNTGCVPIKEMLEIIIKKSNFQGPISIHLEYNYKNDEEKLNHIKEANTFIRETIKNLT